MSTIRHAASCCSAGSSSTMALDTRRALARSFGCPPNGGGSGSTASSGPFRTGCPEVERCKDSCYGVAMKIGSVPLPMRVVCVSFALWLAGCGNTTRAGTDGGTGDATTTSDATRVLPDARAATDLGESCVGSCETRFESCTMDDTSCDTGICLFDARSDRADAYCTVGCPGGECPEGWECLEAGDGSGRFCLAESSVCGDGRIGRGEVCDPGPSVGTPPSGCSADCMDAFSAGSVSYDWDGFTQSVSGSSEGGEVRAEQITGVEGQTVVAVFNPGAGGLVLTLRIVVEGLTGPLPETALGQVRV